MALLWVSLGGTAQNLDWNTYPDGSLSHTFPNVGTPAVNVGVSVTGGTSYFTTNEPNGRPAGLRLSADFPANGFCVSVNITFSEPVYNLNFPLLDIDYTSGDSKYEDVVTVTGSNGGTSVTPSIGSAATNTVSGNTVTGINSNVAQAQNLVTFSGAVTEITIQYCAGPSFALPERQEIYIGDFNWEAAPLPVRLASFSGKRVENQVRLGWQTTFESNSAYFVVERSADAKAFEALGRVVSSGFSESLQAYGFTDEAPVLGTNYYRLRQVDQDGRFEYSKIIGVGYDPAEYYFEVRALDQGQIEVLTNVPEPVFNIMDSRGVSGSHQVVQTGSNRYTLQLRPTGLASPALKIVQIRAQTYQNARKVLLTD
ncbi:hypothetical protein ACO2Q8_14575 [Larkinella sp. VNQ87]|uniref:hypothetical protein n=1 Tax=Larkinella sp. VNQ87 TaxID=3400921 RepID=UPI003C0928E3